MPAALTNPKRSQYEALPDNGCQWSPRCTSCVWIECVPEMTPQRRGEFLTAYRGLAAFLRRPDGVLD